LARVHRERHALALPAGHAGRLQDVVLPAAIVPDDRVHPLTGPGIEHRPEQRHPPVAAPPAALLLPTGLRLLRGVKLVHWDGSRKVVLYRRTVGHPLAIDPVHRLADARDGAVSEDGDDVRAHPRAAL